jgi:glycosyltransferase involved in cell wall biosynthesis
MKTAVIVSDHAFVNGGQAKVAIDTALALRAEGLAVHFFSGVGPVDKRLSDAGVDCTCLGQFDLLGDPSRTRSALQGLWNRRAALELDKLLLRLDPTNTIVHVHGWAKSLSPSIGSVLASRPIPHIYTLHEYFLACPTGGFYDHQRQAICTRRPLGVSCLTANCDSRSPVHKAWRVGRQAVLWSAGAMPRALRDLIYLTETQLQIMRQYLPASARLHHLPNPVVKTATQRVYAERNDVFLFVGRLSAEKGAEVAAKAAREAKVRIAFAGEGECRSRIVAANPEAQMLGWLKADTLSEWTSKARCLVFPSLWHECHPMSVIEAMQRGLPILVSSHCAAAELVRHNADGLHVRADDVEAWAKAMRLLSEPNRVACYSRSSFEASRSFLDAEFYGRRLLTIYEKAAAAQRKERLKK